ncbi:MAG: hypothetical protein WC373_17165 [Smithella sp.]
MNKINNLKTEKDSQRERRAWPFLLVAIILALLAAETIHSCLYVLYLVFIKKEQVFGLPVSLAMGAVFSALFAWGAIMAFLKYRRIKIKHHN